MTETARGSGVRRRSWIGAALLASALAPAPLRESRLPDTAEGRRVAAFLSAVNAGTEAAMRSFVESSFSARALRPMPPEARVRRLWGFAREAGPLELEKLLEPLPAGPGVLVRSKKTGRWYEVRLELEPEPARGIMGVDIEDSDASAMQPEPALRSEADVAKAADAYLAGLAGQDRFSGVALLARRGEPFFEKAYGLADREKRIPNTPTTRFNIGSIDKVFTQVAIAQLVSAGRIALSDTIRKRLPDYPSATADEITILQLVSMTSGLGDIFNERYPEAAPRLLALTDYLKLFADEPLLFPPGSGRRYSNAGYIVLGLVIEKASGQSYHEYVREHVFAPSGMTSSGPSERGSAAAGRAIGYTRESEGAPGNPTAPLHPNTASLPARSSSAGGGFSTVRDLLAFDLALANGKLLPPEWTAWISSDKSGPPSGSLPPGAGEGLGIAGGAPGINAAVESNGRDWAVIVLANLDPPVAERAARRFRRWMERVGGKAEGETR